VPLPSIHDFFLSFSFPPFWLLTNERGGGLVIPSLTSRIEPKNPSDGLSFFWFDESIHFCGLDKEQTLIARLAIEPITKRKLLFSTR
jgi:hypothetical protein